MATNAGVQQSPARQVAGTLAAWMCLVRMRSARFMVALVLSIAAFIVVLVSLKTLAPMAG